MLMNADDFLSFARHLSAVLVGAGIGLSQALGAINISECSVACVKKKAARTHSTPNLTHGCLGMNGFVALFLTSVGLNSKRSGTRSAGFRALY